MFRHVYKHTNKTIRIILCRGGGGCNHIIPRPIVGLPESVTLDLLDFSQKLGDLSRDVNSFDVKQHVKGYTISSILNL